LRRQNIGADALAQLSFRIAMTAAIQGLIRSKLDALLGEFFPQPCESRFQPGGRPRLPLGIQEDAIAGLQLDSTIDKIGDFRANGYDPVSLSFTARLVFCRLESPDHAPVDFAKVPFLKPRHFTGAATRADQCTDYIGKGAACGSIDGLFHFSAEIGFPLAYRVDRKTLDWVLFHNAQGHPVAEGAANGLESRASAAVPIVGVKPLFDV